VAVKILKYIWSIKEQSVSKFVTYIENRIKISNKAKTVHRLFKGVYLSASGHTFGRPIHGQMEIVGLTMPDSTSK
jgi:predicted transcriptional regulator